jgi:hypothetical protein
VNGDGIDDLLVGRRSQRGRHRPRPRLRVLRRSTPDTTADVTISGTENGGQLGAAVSRAGDVNHDNRRDFVVGAPFEDPNGRTDAGSAYLFFGGPAVDNVFDLAFDGAEAGARFGAAVAGPGDFDGGDRDVIIGAPFDDADGNATNNNLDRGSAFCSPAARTSTRTPMQSSTERSTARAPRPRSGIERR